VEQFAQTGRVPQNLPKIGWPSTAERKAALFTALFAQLFAQFEAQLDAESLSF
jgi:hypothetical protein